MGAFDNYNYDINKGLPEFWKQDIFLTPIERFSALLMRDAIQKFMEKMGVLQPFMVWKTLPEEYNWQWGFEDYDLRLANNDENQYCNQTLSLGGDNHIVAQLPLTKRNVHGYIVIELSSMSFSDSTEYTPIQELIIKNADQILKIKDINSKTTIEIYTENNIILINDSEPKKGQIEGSLDIIKRTPRENPNNIDDPLDINEKCELEIYLSNGEAAYCDLYIELFHPVYVTEQNIRLHSLSAFPLEYVRLYGYMCHEYNHKHQWVYLWEKTYAYQDRIIYDKIAKQYDCEIFYIEVKLYGLPAPLYIGFPATRSDSIGGVFALNETLDYWGGILHIPRRLYKTDIPEDKERYCFPKYYTYPIEQDYPYEQRLLNEYKYNEDWQDFINIRDTEGADIALVKCKDPYIDNIYMYTETILPTDILNSQTTLQANCIKELNKNNETLQQAVWETPENLRYDSKSYSIVTLKNQNENNITQQSYKANVLALEYDLSTLPPNANIRGIELKFKGTSNTHANNIYIDDRSFLRYTKKVLNSETGNHSWQNVSIPLADYFDLWSPDNTSYILGDKESIFGINEIIDRDSIEKGYLKDNVYQSNKIRIDIGFSNLSEYLDLVIKLFNIQLIVYLDIIKENIETEVIIPNKTIIYDNTNNQSSTIDIDLSFTNNGDVKEINYNSFVILPPELCFVENNEFNYQDTIQEFYLGNLTQNNDILGENDYHVLQINETWSTTISIGAKPNPVFKSGRYDIIFICGEHISIEEVFVYDKDYAVYNNIIQNSADDNIVLSFDESKIIADNHYGHAHISLTKDNKPYPYQYIYIDNNGQIDYYILDENGRTEIIFDADKSNGYITAHYSTLHQTCRVLPSVSMLLIYDTSINNKVILEESQFKSSSKLYIDWGDNTIELCHGRVEHIYEDEKYYTIRILGDITELTNISFSRHDNLIQVQSSTIVSMEAGAFFQCSNLQAVNFPNATDINSGVFSECTRLADVSLPNANIFGDAVFQSCSSLQEISLPNAVECANALFRNCTALTMVECPNLITTGNAVFEGCTSLTNYVLPKLKIVPSAMFSGCVSLTEAILENVETIQAGAFNNCTSLVRLIGNKVTSIATGFDFNSQGNYPLRYVELNNLTNIPVGLFSNHKQLEEASFNNATTINSNAFDNCFNLHIINIPNVTHIDGAAFSQCLTLQTIEMPNLVSLGGSVFINTQISHIILPTTLQSFNSSAFMNMPLLTDITFLSTTPPTVSGTWSPPNTVTVHIPCNTLETYKHTRGYLQSIHYIEECD